MKTIPLTVLLYEGPMARAYLLRLRAAGMKPERIIKVLLTHHPHTGKKIAAFLPRFLREGFLDRFQQMNQNYWVRHIAKTSPGLVAAIAKSMEEYSSNAKNLVTDLQAPTLDYAQFSDEVISVPAEGMNDSVVIETLKQLPSPSTVLFTGGGILRREILSLENVRFLHVHPGTLPHVRGADGLLWSTLVRRSPGASCFYMEPGIDTGEIVATRDFSALKIRLPDGVGFEAETLYRALFCFCDPLLRAELLVSDVLEKQSEFHAMKVQEQDTGEGVTYHFMHPEMRRTALETIFIRERR